MNYGYECKGWTTKEMGDLAEELSELWGDIEINGLYPGVRIRRLPKDVKKVGEIVKAADTMYQSIDNGRKIAIKFGRL